MDPLLKCIYYNLRSRTTPPPPGGEESSDHSYVIRGAKITNLRVIVDVIFVLDWLVLFVDVIIGWTFRPDTFNTVCVFWFSLWRRPVKWQIFTESYCCALFFLITRLTLPSGQSLVFISKTCLTMTWIDVPFEMFGFISYLKGRTTNFWGRNGGWLGKNSARGIIRKKSRKCCLPFRSCVWRLRKFCTS